MSHQPSFTQRVEVSPLLSRLESFLPQIKQANEELERNIQEHGREAVDIENTHGQDQVIHMNLSLGVLEERSKEDVADGGIKIPGITAPGAAAQGSSSMCNTDISAHTEILLPWSTKQDDMQHDSDDDDDNNNNNSFDTENNTDCNDDDDEIVTLPSTNRDEFIMSRQFLQKQAPIKSSDAVTILHNLGYQPVNDSESPLTMNHQQQQQQRQQPEIITKQPNANDDQYQRLSSTPQSSLIQVIDEGHDNHDNHNDDAM